MEHHFFARTELPENLSGYGRGIILEWAERKKQAEDRSRVRGVHHISLKCGTKEEFEKAKNFYIDLLGFREVRSWPEGIMIDFGNGMLEIFSNGPGIKTKGALRHIAFATDDVDGVTEKVKSAGYEVFIEPKDIVIPSDPAYPARMAFCYGPLREEIEFFQER
ncbi:MAG: VOC family protein [Lachnospiraceae bacterium]|nr:VOC family protein [Lachnospiraceae bacterium]